MREPHATAPTSSTEAEHLQRLYVLVLRCQTGDQEAFGDLYRLYAGRTRRYLRGILGEGAADDVQQDVWLTVYRRIAEVANPAGFRTWLYRVTRHRAIDALRREQRRSEVVTGPSDDLADVPADEASDAAFDRDTLEPVLARLSDAHREVLVLRFWEDMSYGEIAMVVGGSVGTVRSRLHHAKLNVAAMLNDDGPAGRVGRDS